MPYDPERRAHVFNPHDRANLTWDGESSHIYLVPPGRTLREYVNEGSLVVSTDLNDHPILDRPTVGMEMSFTASGSQFFAKTYGKDALEEQIKALEGHFKYKKGRLGLTSVAGGIAGAPEVATALLMYRKENPRHTLPGYNYPHKWMLVDVFAGIPYSPGLARLGNSSQGRPLHLAGYPAIKPVDNPGAAILIIPESAVPKAVI